jgi:hypothetical protein
MSRVFAAGLGDHDMVVEDVSIEVETSRGEEAGDQRGAGVVGAARGFPGKPVLALPQALPGLAPAG